MSSESFNPSSPWGLCDFRVSQFCDPTLVCHHLLAVWFWASYWTSLSLIFILCTHCWKLNLKLSLHPWPSWHPSWRFWRILLQMLFSHHPGFWDLFESFAGLSLEDQPLLLRAKGDRRQVPALCCCELGIDLRKAREPWLQSSHITGSREKSVYLSESDGTDGEVKGRLITRWLKKVWAGLGNQLLLLCLSWKWLPETLETHIYQSELSANHGCQGGLPNRVYCLKSCLLT